MPRSTSSRVELPDSLQELRPYMELPEEADDDEEEHLDDDDGEEEIKIESPSELVSKPTAASTDMKMSSSLSPTSQPQPPPPEPTNHILDHPLTDIEPAVDTDVKISGLNGTAQPSPSLVTSSAIAGNKNSKSTSIPTKSRFESNKSTKTLTSHPTITNPDPNSNSESPSSPTMKRLLSRAPRAEFMFLAAAWLVYLVYAIAALGLFEKRISLGIDVREIQKRLLGGGGDSSSSSSSSGGGLPTGAGWFGSLFNHDRQQPALGFGRGHGHGLNTATATGTGMGNWFGKWAGNTSPRLSGLGHRGAGRWS